MKKFYLTLLFMAVLITNVSAQNNFLPGYFVTEDGNQVNCLIKNYNWKINPDSFEYKLNKNSKTQILRLPNTKVVVITDAFKFEKHTVQIDASTNELKRLGYDRKPNWKEKTVFLNVLLEGKATLFLYAEIKKNTFLYQKDGGPVTTLVHKIYTNVEREILHNNRYHQQLATEFQCENISENFILKRGYKTDNLVKFFEKYNECKNADYKKYVKERAKGEFHLRATLGMQATSARSDFSILTGIDQNGKTDYKFAPAFGIDLEYILPFARNKFAAFASPNYSSVKSEKVFQDASIERRFEFNYSAIQIPVGFRYYMFLEDNTSKLYASGAVVFDIPLTQEVSGFGANSDEFNVNPGLRIGLGYSFNDKYFVQAGYIFPRELLNQTGFRTLKLHQFNFTLGYRIF